MSDNRESTSIMIKPELWKRVKMCAIQNDLLLVNFIELAVTDLLKKLEKR